MATEVSDIYCALNYWCCSLCSASPSPSQ